MIVIELAINIQMTTWELESFPADFNAKQSYNQPPLYPDFHQKSHTKKPAEWCSLEHYWFFYLFCSSFSVPPPPLSILLQQEAIGLKKYSMEGSRRGRLLIMDAHEDLGNTSFLPKLRIHFALANSLFSSLEERKRRSCPVLPYWCFY